MILLNKPLKPDLTTLTSYISQVNDSGWYTNFGPLHELLTTRLENYLGVENLLLVSNGTLALQVAFKTLNINSAITTPFSFVATTSSMLWQSIETAFSDIDKNNYNLCPKALESAFTEDHHYDGIVATHVYGNPCNVKSISDIAQKFDKKVVYDASHAFDVKLGVNSVLNYGDASTLSFHATKVFHTVEGGAIIFKNKSDYNKAKQLINFGIQKDGLIGEPGINAKLNEYQCAVGLTLLDNIDRVIEHRSNIFKVYKEKLKGIVEFPKWHPESTLNGAYMPIYIQCKIDQEKVMQSLAENNIQCRRYFTPSLDLAFTKLKNFGCPNSTIIACGVICLPLHAYIKLEDVFTITDIIKRVLK